MVENFCKRLKSEEFIERNDKRIAFDSLHLIKREREERKKRDKEITESKWRM